MASNSNGFWEALTDLAKEKNISMDVLIETIEVSLQIACKNNFGKAENAVVEVNRETGDYHVYLAKEVVEVVEDSVEQISLEDALAISGKYALGDIVNVEVKSKDFGRIAATAAKNTITQKIREEERKVLYEEYYALEHTVVTGVVTRFSGNNIHINLGKLEGFLAENEQVKGEHYKPQDRIKVYIV
ncbi:MAG: transcription termination/antitermination protein NusA, partial [Bacteroidaceae bacterium]|nr:transcription termination/antitermination protein NusA [Bacteroidaceae bacterium]